MLKKVVCRTSMILGIILFYILAFLIGSALIVFNGDNESTRDVVAVTLMETSAGKFVPRLFLSERETNEILSKNTVVYLDEKIDDKLVVINDKIPDQKDIELVDISGGTYKGKMLIISDPKRLYVATPATFDSPTGGMKVEDYVARDKATAGVNGGGFADVNGVGNGGTPVGYVIQDSKITFGYADTFDSVVGFDKDGRLIVGRMTAQEALNLGAVDALTFGPVGPLIINSEPLDIKGTGGGLNPRTAIGQRADGSILLLCIDGRQAHSLGASYKDLIDIFVEYGAVNASNLDGGSSSLMVYEDEIISVTASLYGSRKLATAVLVK